MPRDRVLALVKIYSPPDYLVRLFITYRPVPALKNHSFDALMIEALRTNEVHIDHLSSHHAIASGCIFAAVTSDHKNVLKPYTADEQRRRDVSCVS